jgi:UDP-N-acetylmuramoylalanine--D-glutamate ligase
MQLAELAGKRIAILGAGREGQATHAWLRARMPRAELTILAEAPAEAAFVQGLQLHDTHSGDTHSGDTRSRDTLIIEPFTASRLLAFDVLVRSPGISPYREALQTAFAAGVRCTTPSSLWFAAHPHARTICVTGTKGKSTTSALLAHLLRFNGHTVTLAGNIGLPLMACADQGIDWWVIELSSYQIADLEAAPTLAVILNLSPEHLDWHGSEEAYFRDKLRLARLAAGGCLIANAADAELAARLADAAGITWFETAAGVHTVGKRLFYQGQALPVSMPKGMPGRHNLLNAAAALTAVLAAGSDVHHAALGISSFISLPHRLQLLGERDGIGFVNDSIATTPVAVVAALDALQDQSVILLVGGFDRGLDWAPYLAAFHRTAPKAVISLPENGPRIIETMRRGQLAPASGFHDAPDLKAAIALARQLASSGDTVLLSPGAPSFPQFSDFRDRGQTFARLCGFECEN